MDWSWNSRATGELQSICLPFAVTGCTLSFAMTLAMNCRFILFVTTMKPNVPSPNPRFHSWRLVRRPVISLPLKLLFVGAATTFAFGLNPAVYALEPGRAWVTSWACSPQGPYPAGWPVAEPDLSFALPHGDTDGATDQTFRLIVKPDLWSKKIRLRLSNTFGSRPITLGAVTVGIQSAAGNILAGKIQEVQFSGKGEVLLPVGEEVYSDEVPLGIDPADPLLEGHKLAISFFVKGASGPLTWHTDSLSTSYLTAPQTGDHTRDVNDAAFPFTSTSWYLLDAIEVEADADTAVVCAFGDSITDGVNSTLNGSDTWPDQLSRRLHSAYGNKVSVVNEAISGNTVTNCPRNGGTSVNGPSASARLDRDVFGVAGLRYVVWLEGINDLGACLASADQVINGFKEVVERLHSKKVKVIGATIVSSFGSPIASYGFPKIDLERKKINDFIRTGGLFDAVADFDAATLDPATGAVQPPFQPNVTIGGPGDLLHPNRAGLQAMAATIDIKTLTPGPGE
jgi:lysophospholipase L1-like esterase